MKNSQATPDCYHELESCGNSDLTIYNQQDMLKNMNMQTCPYCKEKIYSNALVCRYCKRDLPDMTLPQTGSSNWIPALLASALIVTGTAFFAYEFFKERQNWVDRE
ncbi:MAG: LPXTG cell wall anchor domain-containing protein [Proteobacteria bacterium]|nr:LPXTG cell wall anchor domain-containing protein [Pseudomonadota bacterium]MBU4297067.1 LPXTG cell wall anchor domain-containing protein [Pseudomonadota bacterium]MCG2749948.1 LPXTG cell wall anchor domain-containing protein [Desulfobulbaceae bacterium]